MIGRPPLAASPSASSYVTPAMLDENLLTAALCTDSDDFAATKFFSSLVVRPKLVLTELGQGLQPILPKATSKPVASGAEMGQSKLETISPAIRRGTLPAAAAPSERPASSNADPLLRTNAARGVLGDVIIQTHRSAPILNPNFGSVTDAPAGELEEETSSRKRWWPLMSGWISLISHTAVLVILALVVKPQLEDKAISLDGLMVDGGHVEALLDPLDQGQQEDNEMIQVDVNAFNSEASPEVADVVHDTGVDVSLLEGMALGDGLEGMASSGLTPLETADDGGITGNGEGGGNEASFFGTKAAGTRFVFIIDFSDSMNDDQRWEQALDELDKAMYKMESDVEVLVLLYNFRTFPMLNIDPEKLELVPVTEEFKKELKDWLTIQRPFGGTRPAHALSYSVSLKPDAIFLLSDGLIVDNSIAVLEEQNTFENPETGEISRIPVHTISLGPDVRGAEVMKLIADDNLGKFLWVK